MTLDCCNGNIVKHDDEYIMDTKRFSHCCKMLKLMCANELCNLVQI